MQCLFILLPFSLLHITYACITLRCKDECQFKMDEKSVQDCCHDCVHPTQKEVIEIRQSIYARAVYEKLRKDENGKIDEKTLKSACLLGPHKNGFGTLEDSAYSKCLAAQVIFEEWQLFPAETREQIVAGEIYNYCFTPN